ncbi:MAG: T9SS type A sorting domain-containing protein [Balneolaceae bacterium]
MKSIQNKALFGLIAIAFLVIFLGRTLLEHAPIHPDSEIIDLKRSLSNYEPGSIEYLAIENHIKELAEVEEENELGITENPGAFWEALAGLKTGPKGETYQLNYKKTAFEVASKNKNKASSITPTWTSRGPNNINGRTRAILVDENDSSGETWFVGTVGGGIWKTTNAGQTWEPKGENFTSLSVTTLAQSGNTIYAGTGMGYGRILDLSGSGIWKSTDNGETWTQLASTSNGELLQAINRIVVDPNDPNIVVVCSNDSYSWHSPKGGIRKSGIFRSTNGGTSWTQTFNPDVTLGTTTDNRVQQIIANPLNFNTLFATVNEVGVIRSRDAGQTWTVVANNMADPNDIGDNDNTYSGISTRIEMAMAPSDTSRLYAAAERPFGIGQLYYSKNAGDSWINLIEENAPGRNWFGAFGRSGQFGYTAGWFDNTITVDPFDKNVVFLGGVELYKADVNDGSNRKNVSIIASQYEPTLGLSRVHPDHHFLVTIPINEGSQTYRVVNANDGGIATSDNKGQTWTMKSGIISTQFYGIDKMPGSSTYIGGMQDNGTAISPENPSSSTDWFVAGIGGDGVEVAWNKRDANQLLGGSQYGRYLKSSDGGLTWYNIPDAKAGNNAPFISKLGTSVQDPDLVFTVGSDGIKRSDDFGDSWTLAPITSNWHGFRAFDNVEVSNASPQVVWASSRIGLEPLTGTTGGVHVSNDGGLSFSLISDNIDFNVLEASGISSHPDEPNTGFLLFSAPDQPKILKTTDLGETWEDLSGFGDGASESTNGFPNVGVFSLIVMPFDTDIIWAGTEIGIFVSEDAGDTWSFLDSDLPHVSIFEMKILDGEVVVATHGRGIWTATIPQLVGYEYPVAVLSPRLPGLALLPTGSISINMDLRSTYDSTIVYVDGELYKKIDANTESIQIQESFEVVTDGPRTVSIISYKDGATYKSPTKVIDAFVAETKNFYVSNNDGSLDASDFVSNGLSINSQSGFTGSVVNSPHPYSNRNDYSILLKTPILISDQNATLTYKDVALVEPGDPGSVFGSSNFWDFVVVEGTSNGVDWLPLADGYDATYNPAWLTAYTNGTNPNSSMLVSHNINLLDTFDAGEVIRVRFRLNSDAAVNGWGWVVNDIKIQEALSSGREPEDGPDSFSLSQNYPNPFNPRTTIEYNLTESSVIQIRIYNTSGQLVQTLYDGLQTQGNHSIQWAPNGLSSGVYFYSLKVGDKTEIRKATLLK